MKLSNQLLKTQLEKNVEGLGRAFGFDGEIKPYFWEISEKGELTAEKILLENKIWDYPYILQSISLDEYNDWLAYRAKRFGEVHDRINTLTQLLDSNLVEFQIYRAYYPDESFHLYIGKTEILEEYGLTEKYRELERYLTQDLNDPQVFVVGPSSNSLFDIYILGRDRDNDWAGVQIEVRLLS